MTPQQRCCKNRYERLKAEHRCVVCGCELDKDAKTIKCEKCRKQASITLKKHFNKRIDNRLCRRCGQPLPEGMKHKACFKCRQAESVARYVKKEADNEANRDT